MSRVDTGGVLLPLVSAETIAYSRVGKSECGRVRGLDLFVHCRGLMDGRCYPCVGLAAERGASALGVGIGERSRHEGRKEAWRRRGRAWARRRCRVRVFTLPIQIRRSQSASTYRGVVRADCEIRSIGAVLLPSSRCLARQVLSLWADAVGRRALL